MSFSTSRIWSLGLQTRFRTSDIHDEIISAGRDPNMGAPEGAFQFLASLARHWGDGGQNAPSGIYSAPADYQ